MLHISEGFPKLVQGREYFGSLKKEERIGIF